VTGRSLEIVLGSFAMRLLHFDFGIRLRNLVEGIRHRAYKFLYTFTGRCRDCVKFQAAFGTKLLQLFQLRPISRGIELRRDDDHRLLVERAAEGVQLARNHFKRVNGIFGREVARVDQMREQPRALNVLQKSDTEPGAFVRTLDQTRKVRDDKRSADLFARSAVGIDHA